MSEPQAWVKFWYWVVQHLPAWLPVDWHWWVEEVEFPCPKTPDCGWYHWCPGKQHLTIGGWRVG